MSSKVKDGLFLGDIDAAQDAEFLQLNGIVHIVNCVPRQVPHLFQQSLGLAYVACDLDEVLRRPFFDLKNRQFMSIVQLIDRALERTESVLVHSLDGINRSPSVMMGYLMVKYCWGVDKAFEFLVTKRADIKPHESYIDQLCRLEGQLQGLFGSRATEQQLYEWHPSLADPSTDEVVLIHTYLNATSTPKPLPTGKAQQPLTGQRTQTERRRLSWIDQIAHMKKLYPSLMIKPERPPNNSYSEMTPADGWVDLITPSASAAVAVPKPIAAFVENSVQTKSTSSTTAPRDTMELEDDAPEVTRGGRRVHSFSVPRHTSMDRSEVDTLADLALSDRDDQDLTIEVTSTQRSTLQSHRVHQQQQQQPRIALLNRAPSRPVRQSLDSNNMRTSINSAVLSGSVRTVPSLPITTVTSATLSSTPKPTATARLAKPTRKSAPPPKSTAKPTISRRSSSSSNGSYSARSSFAGELPLPPTTSAFSVRRALVDLADPWATTNTTPPVMTNRPRTAPPRLRKKDSDSTQFTPQPGGLRTTAPSLANVGAIHRVNITTDYTPASHSTAWSASAAAAASFRAQRLSSRSAPAAATATATRAKTTRAHWK